MARQKKCVHAIILPTFAGQMFPQNQSWQNVDRANSAPAVSREALQRRHGGHRLTRSAFVDIQVNFEEPQVAGAHIDQHIPICLHECIHLAKNEHRHGQDSYLPRLHRKHDNGMRQDETRGGESAAKSRSRYSISFRWPQARILAGQPDNALRWASLFASNGGFSVT